jgi:hypothetical protein
MYGIMSVRDSLRRGVTFKQQILLKCYEALTTVGFTHYRKENVDWPLENGFHGWIGLNTGLYDEYVEINPFVGIHVVPIEKLWLPLKGRKYNRGVATYALHMGLLAPHTQPFEFTRATNISEEATRLAQFYMNVGLPYANLLLAIKPYCLYCKSELKHLEAILRE